MFVRIYPRGVRGLLSRALKPDKEAEARALNFENYGATLSATARAKKSKWPALVEVDDSGARLTGRTSGRLDQVLDHPELYAREPRLRRIKVNTQSGSLPDGAEGQAIPVPGFRSIKQDKPDLGVLLHEVQHQADSLGRVKSSPSIEPWDVRPHEQRAEAVRLRMALSPEQRAQYFPFSDAHPYGFTVPSYRLEADLPFHPEDMMLALPFVGAAGGLGAVAGAGLLRKRPNKK